MKVFGQAGRAGPVGYSARFVPNKRNRGVNPVCRFTPRRGISERKVAVS